MTIKTTHYYFILKKLQEIDFILADLTCYLDQSPTDKEAIAQLKDYYIQRKELIKLYESNYGSFVQPSIPCSIPNNILTSPLNWHL